MKGVSFLTDENNRKTPVVIDLKTIERYEEEVEELLDGIIAEARRDEEKVPLNEVNENLKKLGKLK